MIATTDLLALTVAWLDAKDALDAYKQSNSARMERAILEAIRYGIANGDTLVLDDLHNALEHVDGSIKADAARFETLVRAELAAMLQLSNARWYVTDYHGIEALMHRLDDPLVESRMVRILDRIKEYAE
jgi:hypothetical protein